MKLMDLQYKIVYKQGPLNQVVDALSRCHVADTVTAVAISKPEWINKVKEGHGDDAKAQELMIEIEAAGGTLGEYTFIDGLIRYQGRIWLGMNKLAHEHILLAIHSSGIGGHSGFTATYYRIKKLFSWPGMKQDIKAFIQACEVCQQAKVQHCKPSGLLQPLPIPD